jgi:hypothetical protein
MSKHITYYIQKRKGWDYNLENSLELMGKNGEPITIQFMEQSYYCGDFEGCLYTPLEIRDV